MGCSVGYHSTVFGGSFIGIMTLLLPLKISAFVPLFM
jgi:hypothetical protein